MRFSFIGRMNYNAENSKRPCIQSGKTKNGAEYQSFHCSVVAETNNRGFVELFGMKPVDGIIKTMDSDGNKIEIEWDDRFLDEEIEKVSPMRKFVVKVSSTERKEFISEWDVIEFLKNNSELINGHMVRISGRTTKNIYNGKTTDVFSLQNIYLEDENVKPQLLVTGDIFYTTEDIDTDDWKSDKKIIINGYTKEYIKDAGQKYVQSQFVFDANKYNFEDAKHVGQLKYKLKQLGLTLEDDGSIKKAIKRNIVYHIPFICYYINGAEEIEFNEDALTDNQKEAIALGLNTIDDFKPKGSIYGNRIVEYRIKNFDITKDEFADGCVDSGMTVDDFGDMVYIPKVIMASEIEGLNKPEPEDDDDDMDLFD